MCLCRRLGPTLVSRFPLVHSRVSLVFDRAPQDRVAEHHNARRGLASRQHRYSMGKCLELVVGRLEARSKSAGDGSEGAPCACAGDI